MAQVIVPWQASPNLSHLVPGPKLRPLLPLSSEPLLLILCHRCPKARISSVKPQNFAPSCFPLVEGCPFPLPIINLSSSLTFSLDYPNPNCSLLSITTVLSRVRTSLHEAYCAFPVVLCMVISLSFLIEL